jgi:choline dehydrogenase-like flavoprotein
VFSRPWRQPTRGKRANAGRTSSSQPAALRRTRHREKFPCADPWLSLLQSKAGFDVIVVGSGMGGGTLADALADAGVNTLLLEAGSLLFPSNVADLPGPNDVFAVKALENLEGSELTRDVCINFGGCSVFWTGLVPRMATWELSRWPDEIADYLTRGGYDDAERTIRKQTEFNAFQQQLRSELEAALPDYEVGFLPRSFHQPTSRLSARAGNPDETDGSIFHGRAADRLPNHERTQRPRDTVCGSQHLGGSGGRTPEASRRRRGARSPDRRAVPVFGAVGCSSGWRNAKPLHRTPKRG